MKMAFSSIPRPLRVLITRLAKKNRDIGQKFPWVKTLFHVETWKNPKSIVILILVGCLGFLLGVVASVVGEYGKLAIGDYYKGALIRAEFEPAISISSSDFKNFSENNGIREFRRNLDDDILTNYLIIPFQIKNDSHNYIGEQIAFTLDLANPNSKILDVCSVVKFPQGKEIVVKTTLQDFKWVWPTNGIERTIQYGRTAKGAANFYVAVDQHCGFGRINTAPIRDEEWRFRFIPHNNLDYFLRVTLSYPQGESDFFTNYLKFSSAEAAFSKESFILNDSANLDVPYSLSSQSITSSREMWKTKLFFESGLDPKAVLKFYVLVKILPGEKINPNLLMEGLPKVFYEGPKRRLEITGEDFSVPLEQGKIKLMPSVVHSANFLHRTNGLNYSEPKSILIWWDIPKNSDYAGVQIYRSKERNFGDYSDKGELVYEGYGETNAFEFDRDRDFDPFEMPKQGGRFAHYFNTPDQPWGKNPVSSGNTTLLPPTILRIERSKGELFDGVRTPYYVDLPPDKASRYTYTIYVFNRGGLSSYPVILNATLDKSEKNYRLYFVSGKNTDKW